MSRASSPSEAADEGAADGNRDSTARTASSSQSATDAGEQKLADWRAVDWGLHQRWVALSGGPVNVIDVGSGPPVLFIHGLGGSWPNWLEQLPVLAEHRRAIALDLPGFGASPMSSEPISIEGYAQTVLELMDTLGVYSAPIVGNSMGGQITAEIALAAPERVERIVLVSPAGISTAAVASRLALIRLAHPLVNLFTGRIGANADSFARRRLLRERAMSLVATQPQRIAPEFAAEQLRGMGKPGFLPALQALIEHSQTLGGRLSSISCPTLVLWGQDDPVVPSRDADAFAERIPNARKVVWEDTGHVAMFERAADFNALLEDFLAESV
ncbi:MAG: alpha/beta fold hydrolase [Solirubrobacteraceae bacterium]